MTTTAKKTHVENVLTRLISMAKRSGDPDEISAAATLEMAIIETGLLLKKEIKNE